MFILSLFLVNDPEALYVNPDCLKFISGINLSPANKKLFKLNSPLAFCSLRDFDFLLLHYSTVF